MYNKFKPLRRNSRLLLEQPLPPDDGIWKESLHEKEKAIEAENIRLIEEKKQKELWDKMIEEQRLKSIVDYMNNQAHHNDEDDLNEIEEIGDHIEHDDHLNETVNDSSHPLVPESNVESLNLLTDVKRNPLLTVATSSDSTSAVTATKAKAFPKSKIRYKLMNLSKFVVGHTNRKIMLCWNTIEARFQKSSYFKNELVKDANGLLHPVRLHALQLSTLTSILCSTKVKVNHTELAVVFSKFKCSKQEILHARKVASIRLILGPNNGAGLKQAKDLKNELQKLITLDERLISCEEFKDAIFPADPEQRAIEEKSLEAEKMEMMNIMMEEKRKKEEAALIQEQRRIKTLNDWDNTLQSIQYVKGPLNVSKHSQLVGVIKYCERSYAEMHADVDIDISPELVTLIGLDSFPPFIQQLLNKNDDSSGPGESKKISAAERRKQFLNNIDGKIMKDRFGYDGAFRIKLQGQGNGHLTVLQLLRETVSYCKGLNGVSYRDVVEWLQAYAAIRLQSAIRSFCRRWRFFGARMKWRKIFRYSRSIHFNAWKYITRHNVDTRRYCWRSLKDWKIYTRRVIKRRNFFRDCHWPFYVWRRWAQANATAKEKSRFLVSRVLPTYLEINVFNGWKKYVKYILSVKSRADNYLRKRQLNAISLHFKWLRWWSYRRKHLRRSWLKEGLLCYLKKRFMRLNTPFQIWRAYAYYKIMVRRRSFALAATFKKTVVHKVYYAPLSLHKRKEKYVAQRHYVKELDKKIKAQQATNKQLQSNELSGGGSMVSGDISGLDSMSTVSTSKLDGNKELKKLTNEMKTLKNIIQMRKSRIFESPSGTFPWEKPFINYDIDSDGEDKEDIPDNWSTAYTTVITQLEQPEELDFLTNRKGVCDDYMFSKIKNMVKYFSYAETWSLLENASRLYQYGRRALKNLYVYAKVRKNARKSIRMYFKRRMMYAFSGLLLWMVRDNKVSSQDTEAEKLKFAVRSTRMNKMVQRRETAAYLKAEHDKVKEDKRAMSSHSKRGVISEDNAVLETSMTTTNAVSVQPSKSNMKLPDPLVQDQKERELETKLSEAMLKLSKTFRDRIYAQIAKADEQSAIVLSAQNTRTSVLETILVEESDATMVSIEKEFSYASEFKIKAADNLLKVLAKVYTEVLIELLRQDMKKYFRALRIPMYTRRSIIVSNRKKLMNWIRICQRLHTMYNKGHFYYARRKQWVIYNRWLKLVETENLNSSPGLISALKRAAPLLLQYSNLLKSNGFVKSIYPNNKKLYALTSTSKGIFYRWAELTQTNKVFHTAFIKATELWKYRLLHKVFYAIRTHMNSFDTLKIRLQDTPFIIKRLKCDLLQISRRFTAKRKKSVVYVIRKFNAKWIHYMRHNALTSLSFKTFLGMFEASIEERLVSEQREMTDAFHHRGTQEVKDVESPDLSEGKIPILMVKSEGRRFFDPIPTDSADDVHKHGYFHGSNDNSTIPGGFKIHKLRVAFQLDVGMVGWQLVWWADGIPRDIEGPKRGKWKGGAITTKEIVVPRDDFVVGVEYWYEASAMYGIRFKLHHGGWTKMVGKKNSMSTLTMYLGVEEAPVEPFETDYMYAGRDEEMTPGFPRRFIIGFCGIEGPVRATCMGLIVRKVKHQHIFSYNWVQDALHVDDQALTNQAAGAEPLEEVLSLPSIVQGGGDIPAGESLTLSSIGYQHSEDMSDADNLPIVDVNHDPRPMDASIITDASAFEMDLSEVKMEDYTVPHQKLTKHDQPLTTSEEQFFDVVRMRTTEVKVAHMRSVDFAKRVFKSKFVRADPQLSKLASVKILCLITKWLFEALSKKLIIKVKTEQEGEYLTETGIKERMRADILQRRTFAISQQIQTLEATPQPWKGKKMLGPTERAVKKAYYDKISFYRKDIVGYNEEILALQSRSAEHLVRGKALMSRIQISKFVCANYALKVAASKHKESLLQLMNIEQIKAALTGNDNSNMALSAADMEMIRGSLRDKTNNEKYFFSLDDVVEHELTKEEPAFTPAAGTLTRMINNNTQTMIPKLRQTIAINSAHWKQTKKKEYANHIYSRSMTSIPTIPMRTKISNVQLSSSTSVASSATGSVSKNTKNDSKHEADNEHIDMQALDLASPRSNK